MSEVKDLNRIEEGNYIILGRTNAPEIYADGVSRILVGYPTTKLTFHTVLEPGEDGKELRRASALITMDTDSAIEMALDILAACKGTEDQLMLLSKENAPARLKQFLDSIPKEIFTSMEPTSVVRSENLKVSHQENLKLGGPAKTSSPKRKRVPSK